MSLAHSDLHLSHFEEEQDGQQLHKVLGECQKQMGGGRLCRGNLSSSQSTPDAEIESPTDLD